MINAPHHTLESLELPKEARAEVLFIDLDETLLDGVVMKMNDKELGEATLIEKTIRLMERAKVMGAKIVLLTRNDYPEIERFFNAKPGIRDWFYTGIGCTKGEKSESINYFLKKNKIPPEKAIFVDDRESEREDVEKNTKGVQTYHPEDANFALTTEVGEKKVTKKGLIISDRRWIKSYLSQSHKLHDWKIEPLLA